MVHLPRKDAIKTAFMTQVMLNESMNKNLAGAATETAAAENSANENTPRSNGVRIFCLVAEGPFF